MKQHTVIGGQILGNSDSEILQISERIAITHHEKYDGTGYPYGVKGDSIPLEGKIVAIADVFDALTSPRCYKPAFPVEKALAIIKEGSGTHFDPSVVEAFLKGLEEILKVREKFSNEELAMAKQKEAAGNSGS
jgi:putative two-component system response regulator